jgi:hypothetical protein
MGYTRSDFVDTFTVQPQSDFSGRFGEKELLFTPESTALYQNPQHINLRMVRLPEEREI